jgi:hypothetical protein
MAGRPAHVAGGEVSRNRSDESGGPHAGDA